MFHPKICKLFILEFQKKKHFMLYLILKEPFYKLNAVYDMLACMNFFYFMLPIFFNLEGRCRPQQDLLY